MTPPKDGYGIVFWYHQTDRPSARPYKTYFDTITALPTAYPLDTIHSSPLWAECPEAKTLQDIVRLLPGSSRKHPIIISTRRAEKLLGWDQFYYPDL